MPTAFGPDGLNFVTNRPDHSAPASAGADTWFQPCSSPALKDGTQITQSWLNMLTGNVREAVRSRGVTLAEGDVSLLADAMATLRDVIDDDVTYSIDPLGGGDFLSLEAALEFIGDKLIRRDKTVTLSLVAGTHEWPTSVLSDHFCGHRIEVVGADLTGSYPVSGDFTGVKATDEAMLRGKFATVIECDDAGIEMRTSIGRIANLLLIGSGGLTGLKTNSEDILAFSQAVHCFVENVWAHDFSNGFSALHQTILAGGPFGASHCASAGLISTYGGVIRGSGTGGKELSAHHCAVGASAVNQAQIYAPNCVFRQSTNQNVRAVQGSFIYVSGGVVAASDTCVQALNGSYIHAANAVATSAATLGFHAASGSFIYAVGATGTGSASPAINTVGNQNSYIQT